MRTFAALAALALMAAGCATPAEESTGSSTPTGPSTTTGATTTAPSSGTTVQPPPPPPGGNPGNQSIPPTAARNWTAPDQATIRPGSNVDDGGCTSNFVFVSPTNASVYLGLAAHCFGNGSSTDTDGCAQPSAPDPLGTTRDVEGASKPGVLVYSSWLTMEATGESSANACADNDFALLRIDPSDVAKVNPAMKSFGGPTGLAARDAIKENGKVLTYGDSSLRFGLDAASPHEGYILAANQDGEWYHTIATVPPGVPGDSGSGVLLGTGEALGVLVTLGAGGNGVTDLRMAMAYAAEHGFPVQLATWELLSDGNLPPL